MKRLDLILNGKGGVGKSFFAVNFVQFLKDKGIAHIAIDSDNENSTLKRFHPDTRFLDLSKRRDLDAIFAALAVPGTLAFLFGYFSFRSRIRGVYFSIISQAVTYALMLLFFRNETGLGGNNGLTDFKNIYGYPLQTDATKVALYILSVAGMCGVYLLARWVTTSKAGRVLRAIRDQEARVPFMGYNVVHFKVLAFTLSAVVCGLAGALYVPQVGIINPSEMQPSNSIEMAIWVAVGGRGSLSAQC